jgi:hypothetical protein
MEMSNPNPAIRTASKRMPVLVIDANSSRDKVRFCSGVRHAKSSGTCESVSSSSGRIWPSPIAPGTWRSGSRMRVREAVDRRAMRWSVELVGEPDGPWFLLRMEGTASIVQKISCWVNPLFPVFCADGMRREDDRPR